MSSPKVAYTYDATVTSNVYNDGLRVISVGYPVAAGAKLDKYFGGDNSLTDLLDRPVYEKLFGGAALNGNEAHTSHAEFNGTGRLVSVWTNLNPGTDVEREMFSSSGNYDGFDRFGRAVRFAWKNASTGNVLDQTDYTYDYAGNRLTRNVRGPNQRCQERMALELF